jgi:hypothetical protein
MKKYNYTNDEGQNKMKAKNKADSVVINKKS